jgi:hypothetical protein
MCTCLNNASTWDGHIGEEGECLSQQRLEASRRRVLPWITEKLQQNE